MNQKVLGILGGLGPLATVYFADLVIRLTDAASDQDHIPMLISNNPLIPDRTGYILDNSKPNPLPPMIGDAKKLEAMGADFIAIPCNTAHYFYDEIQHSVAIPVVNMVEEAVRHTAHCVDRVKKVGVLATSGTIAVGIYERMLARFGLEYAAPAESDQTALMDIIYKQVKAGRKADTEAFFGIVSRMKDAGCDAVILACTELSVVYRDSGAPRNDTVDALEVLALKSVELCGKKVKQRPLAS